MTLYLSRLRLSRSPQIDALSYLLDPAKRTLPGEDPIERGRRTDAHHRLVWSAFAGDSAAKRDFLWRSDGDGVFLVLSPHPPSQSPLFEPPEVKVFDPDLQVGAKLAFTLRCNATRTFKTDELTASGKARKKQRDVVMLALHGLAKAERAEVRLELAQQEGSRWLMGQGVRAGFAIADPDKDIMVADYSVVALPGHAGKRMGQPQYGILEMTGVLSITDPGAFLKALSEGFGRAKAFGCGLMLIRRA